MWWFAPLLLHRLGAHLDSSTLCTNEATALGKLQGAYKIPWQFGKLGPCSVPAQCQALGIGDADTLLCPLEHEIQGERAAWSLKRPGMCTNFTTPASWPQFSPL